MSDNKSKKTKSRVNRVVGQVAGIQLMVDGGRDFVDVPNQIAAVRSALDALGVELLANHLESCVRGQGSGQEHPRAKPMTKEQLVSEVQTVLSKLLKQPEITRYPS